MSLKDNLPNYIACEKYTKEVLEAIEPEIDKIKFKLSQCLLETCVSRASEYGINKFEKDYAIKYGAMLTLNERRRKILSKMLSKKTLTFENLFSLIKANVDKKQFYVLNNSEEYRFQIMLIDENYKEKLYRAIYEARPAHLVFEVTITKYERRCGTFVCSGHQPI